MKELKDFTNKQEFLEFLANHPENGNAFPDIQYDELYDTRPRDWIALNAFTISFDGYNKFYLKMHPQTNELFLADMNDGGHATLFRVIKIHRDEIFTRKAWLEEWYDEHPHGRSWRFWP